MSTSLAAPQEQERIASEDDTALIVSGGPSPDGGSGWFDTVRATGWESFQQLPAPTRTDEKWRFASIKALGSDGYRKARPVSSEVREQLIERSVGLAKNAGRMVFANDELLTREAHSKGLVGEGGYLGID